MFQDSADRLCYSVLRSIKLVAQQGVICTLFLIAACNSTNQTDQADDSDSTNLVNGSEAVPGTALHYAVQCQEHLGRIPGFSCKEGIEIPIYVDGTIVQADQELCDNPDLKGQCKVGSYIGQKQGMGLDGKENSNVKWVYFCRRDDNFAQMIGYNKLTGATCFFELKDGYMPLVDGVQAGSVPTPSERNYEAAWKKPEDVASQQCNECHTPDPFIHTPFSRSALIPGTGKPVLPEIASPESRYFVVGEEFKEWGLHYVKIEGNACTSCHRMPDFLNFTFGSGVNYNEHMPPLNPGSMTASYDEFLKCLEQGPQQTDGCEWGNLVEGQSPWPIDDKY